MEHSSGELLSISLSVAIRDGTSDDGDCRVDGHFSPELVKALPSLSWWNQKGTYIFKQFLRASANVNILITLKTPQ